MIVSKLENGNLLIPRRAEADDGTIGDGQEEIGPDHPDYLTWLSFWEQRSSQTS